MLHYQKSDEVPSELCRSPQSTTNKTIKLACTIISFVYAFHITEETSLKLLRGRFKHFILAIFFLNSPSPAKSGYESKINRVQEEKKIATQCLKAPLKHTWS